MSLLPDAVTFRRLVDGSTRGFGPTAARVCLATLAVPYAAAVAARNAAYDAGLLPVRKATVPVVSIGNLTLGGTGKTPLVAWAARRLAEAGRRPAIVSRGYGAAPGAVSDEAAELAIVVPVARHLADRDRLAGARAAAAAGADCVVLDDGFQHRRLDRDLDVVAVDATDPFGCGRLFPRGLLRESPAGIARADAIVFTRCEGVDAARLDDIRGRVSALRRAAPPAVWAEAEHRPVGLRPWGGDPLPLDDLRGRRIAAFAAIGNPEAFRGTLEALGAEVAGFRPLVDHHAYGAADIEAIAAFATACRADYAITTLKDLVKIRRRDLDGLPLAALEIALHVRTGADELAAAVIRAVGRAG